MQHQSDPHRDPRFAPFHRLDRYGVLGLAPQPPLERLRLVLMSVFIVPIRILLVLACLLLCNATTRIAQLFPSPAWRNGFCAAMGRAWCTIAAACLGFNVRWVKLPGSRKGARAAGIVSNHCSWADILIHMGHSFPSFAAREGTQQLPLVGFISQKIQCVYVVREKDSKDSNAQGVSALIKGRMVAKGTAPNNHDRYMLMFPEATTTNGRYLLPFKTGAFLAGMPLQPVLMKYDPQSALSPCWDTINVVRLIWLLMCQPWHNVTCYELPIYEPSEEERVDPVLYAHNMRRYMLQFAAVVGMKLEPSEATYATKLEYHGMVFKKDKGQEARSNGDAAEGGGAAAANGKGKGAG